MGIAVVDAGAVRQYVVGVFQGSVDNFAMLCTDKGGFYWSGRGCVVWLCGLVVQICF